DGRGAELRIGGVRLSSVRADDEAQLSLAAARQPALGRLTVHEIATGSGKIVGRACAVGSLLLAHHEQEINAAFAFAYELLGCRHHCSCDSLRVARAAA